MTIQDVAIWFCIVLTPSRIYIYIYIYPCQGYREDRFAASHRRLLRQSGASPPSCAPRAGKSIDLTTPTGHSSPSYSHIHIYADPHTFIYIYYIPNALWLPSLRSYDLRHPTATRVQFVFVRQNLLAYCQRGWKGPGGGPKASGGCISAWVRRFPAASGESA